MKRVIIPLLSATIVVSLILGGCARPAAGPDKIEEGLKVKDVPELQELVERGNIDPELLMNPMEGVENTKSGTVVATKLERNIMSDPSRERLLPPTLYGCFPNRFPSTAASASPHVMGMMLATSKCGRSQNNHISTVKEIGK